MTAEIAANLLSRARILLGSDLTAAKKNVSEAMQRLKQSPENDQMAEAQQLSGIIENLHGNAEKAMAKFTSAHQLFENTGNEAGQAGALSGIGNAHFLKMEYPQAVRSFLRALTIRERIGDKQGMAGLYINLGNCYQRMSNFKQAAAAFGTALRLAKNSRNEMLTAAGCLAFSSFLILRKRYKDSQKYLLSAMKIRRKNGDEIALVPIHNNMGMMYAGLHQNDKAKSNFEMAIELSHRHNLKEENIRAYVNLGVVFMTAGQLEEAKLHLQKVIQLAGTKRYREQRMIAYRRLSELYENEGEHRKALAAFRKFYWQQHLHMRNENIAQMNRFQTQFDLARKDREKEIFKLKNVDLKNAVRHLDDERKKSDLLLRNILPDEIAADLKRQGNSPVKFLKEVTIVFSDIKGFTRISEKHAPEDLVAELDYCFKHFDEIMEQHGLEKIKTIGDAYMCACGLPKPKRGHALRAVRAAVDMAKFMKHRKREREKNGEFAFELRIGVNSGPVIAGIIGTKKFAYDIWGDSVNIAARMEQKSEAGQINISESTYVKVKREFKLRIPRRNRS